MGKEFGKRYESGRRVRTLVAREGSHSSEGRGDDHRAVLGMLWRNILRQGNGPKRSLSGTVLWGDLI
jgi:hypothetical protein